LPLVREDRGERPAGVPVIVPTVSLGSHGRNGSALKASKCEAVLKMRSPMSKDSKAPARLAGR
jgi:hypothetical protein